MNTNHEAHAARPALRLTAALTLALGASVAAAQDAAPKVAPDAGKRFYEKVCARCHEAGIGPMLLGRELPPVLITTIARSGRNAMPAFRISDVDDQTLEAVAAFVSTSKAKP